MNIPDKEGWIELKDTNFIAIYAIIFFTYKCMVNE